MNLCLHVILLRQVLMAGLQVAEVTSCNVLHARGKICFGKQPVKSWRLRDCRDPLMNTVFYMEDSIGILMATNQKASCRVLAFSCTLSGLQLHRHRKRSVSVKGCCLSRG